MNMLEKTLEKIIEREMRQTIRKQLESYKRRGIVPTTEQVMQGINDNALATLTLHGFPPERIKSVIDDELRRCK